VRELVASGPAAGLEWSGLTDAIKVLVGRGDLQPALPGENDAERAASAGAFNAAVTALAKDSDDLGYLASPVTGGGVRVDRLTQLYLQAKRDGGGDPVATLAALAERGGGMVDRNDNKLAPEEARAALADRVARLERRTIPLLERLGVR
jgi:hypothetical protein